MILIVTGQYAGGEYFYPLIRLWEKKNFKKYTLISTSFSQLFWRSKGINFEPGPKKSGYEIRKFLNNLRPSVILLSASADVDLEFLIINQAKKLGILTSVFIDTWTNYRNRFIYNKVFQFPDIIGSIDKKCSQEMVDAGIPENKIKIMGQPYLQSLLSIRPVSGNETLVAIQEISSEMALKLGYDHRTFLKIILDLDSELLNQMNVRFSSPKGSQELKDFFQSITRVCEVGKGVEDVKGCNTVLGMYSTQLITGYLLDKKVVSIQPFSPKIDPCPLSRWGLIPRVNSTAGLRKSIESPQIENSGKDSLKNGLVGSLERLEAFCLENCGD